MGAGAANLARDLPLNGEERFPLIPFRYRHLLGDMWLWQLLRRHRGTIIDVVVSLRRNEPSSAIPVGHINKLVPSDGQPGCLDFALER